MGLGHWLTKKLGSYLTHKKANSRSYLCDFSRICQEVRPADVLLVEGRNRISQIIQRVTLSPWSHAALYIGRLHDVEDPQLREFIQQHYQGLPTDQLLIETIVGKGTIISSIRAYQDDHIRICRPSGLSYEDAQKIVNYTAKSIGQKYDLRNFFDLGRFLLRSRFIPAKVGSSLFNYNSTRATEDICSAVIAAAFNSIHFPILPLIRKNSQQQVEMIRRNPRLFAPSDFDYSPYFNIIKYPIFPVSEELAPYKRLPWNDNEISNDDLGILDLKKLQEEQAALLLKKQQKALKKNEHPSED